MIQIISLHLSILFLENVGCVSLHSLYLLCSVKLIVSLSYLPTLFCHMVAVQVRQELRFLSFVPILKLQHFLKICFIF
jgi:hypothetical protein